MIFYVLAAAFLAGLGAGGYSAYQWEEGKIARQAQKQEKAQAHIDELTRKAEQEAANKLIDMDAAFAAGEAQQKVITKTVYVKGQSYVAAAPKIFANPDCVLPDSSLQLYNSEIARVRAAAVEAFGFAVPATGGSDERAVRDSIHIRPGTTGGVPGVHQELQPVPQGPGVSGQSVQRPPKPSPK